MYELAPVQPEFPHVAAFDCETYLIRPGLLVPKLVCASYDDGSTEGVFKREDALDWLAPRLADPNTVLLTHNGPFDMAVCIKQRPELLELVFLAYLQGRIRDTRIRQKLIDISKGEHKFHWDERKKCRQKTDYALDQLVWRHFGRVLPKQDTFRLRFAELDGLEVEDYPNEAYSYALRDSVETRAVHFSQDDEIDPDDDETVPFFPNELPQTCSAWALHLMSAWGLRTDPKAAYELRDHYKDLVDEAWKKLKEWGLVRANGTKNMAAIRARIQECYEARGLPVPKTDGGQIATDADALSVIAEDEQIKVLDEVGEAEHTLTAFVPIVLEGVDHPINPAFNALVESGRTSCGKPNLHNPPRKGGVRECFVPRPGFVYASCDYDTLELRTLSQACLDILGESSMAEAIKRGEDLHASFGAELLGMDYGAFDALLKGGDKAAEDTRQLAKPGNFGFPGGMGGTAFAAYASGYGVKIDAKRGVELQRAWLKKWPEMSRYFNHISAITSSGEGTLVQLRSGRVRGGLRYTQAANSYFQGLAADGAKDALWHVTMECYLGRKPDGTPSPLFGCRPVVFLHDEIILEIREDKRNPAVASEAAKRLKQVMEDRMQHWLPDVPAKASAVLMRRWYKGAKPVYDENKNMVPSKPVFQVIDGKKKTLWVADMDEERRAA